MKISFVLSVFFFSLTYAHAQSTGHREPRETTKLTKHQELASAKLSEAQMQAYTKRARQKLADMVDYIRLCINTKDTPEQKKAFKQLQNLFVEVPYWAKSLSALYEYVGKEQGIALAKSVVTQELAYQNTQTYKGSLAYTWAGRQDQLNFIVRKNKKQVGSQELEVWEVFLSAQ